MDWLLGLHAVATGGMFGLIWFVQLVHYPLYHRVGVREFAAYELEHTRRTSWVVGPLMGTESVTACVLALGADLGPLQIWAWVGLVLLAAIWISTAVLQVPCHRKLTAGYDPAAARRLVAGNWVRTLAWTARSAIAIILLIRVQR